MVMLSVCGTADDLPMLEQMLRIEDRQTRAGLDAMLGCYLTLAGSGGMGLVEDLFLKNPKAEYTDTYAAIMALRFLGTETEAVPRERILQGFHALLDRPELADLIIPDLARWEDWSQVDRLAKLFQEADKKSSWVRVPIINYLRTCPRPEAKGHLAALAKIDPDAVKRAETFFPFGGGGSPAPLPRTPQRLFRPPRLRIRRRPTSRRSQRFSPLRRRGTRRPVPRPASCRFCTARPRAQRTLWPISSYSGYWEACFLSPSGSSWLVSAGDRRLDAK